MAQGKEGSIQKNVLDVLELMGCVSFAYVTSAGLYKLAGRKGRLRIGFIGLSDISGMMEDGRHLAIEVKRPKEKPTDEQVEHIVKVILAGGVACVIDDASDVQERVMQIWKEQTTQPL